MKRRAAVLVAVGAAFLLWSAAGSGAAAEVTLTAEPSPVESGAPGITGDMTTNLSVGGWLGIAALVAAAAAIAIALRRPRGRGSDTL
jgi:hypothetical protein